MVQIILFLPGYLSIILSLYIPHGSDNTFFVSNLVQNLIFLYIPHGSDNTELQDDLEAQVYSFISHMVQIILLVIFCKSSG